MMKLRIDVIEGGRDAATITVPAWMIDAAARAMPGGQSRAELASLAALVHASGGGMKLLEVEDHEDQAKIVFSMVGDD